MSTRLKKLFIPDVNQIFKSTKDVCKRLTGGLKPPVMKYVPKEKDSEGLSDEETKVLLKRLLQTLFFGILFNLPLWLYSPTDDISKNYIYPVIIFILFSVISLFIRYKAKIISLVHSKSSIKMAAYFSLYIPEYDKFKNYSTNTPTDKTVPERLPFPHNCMIPMHATLVAIGIVYLLKIYTYPNFLLTFLSLTVAACQYSLIKIPYEDDNEQANLVINNGYHYTRCSYFISCVGILALQSLCQSFFKKFFVDFEYKSVSFLAFDITKYMKEVLYNFIPLQCLFFAFDILPNIKQFYKFLLEQSDTKPKSSRNNGISAKIELLYKPAIKLIFAFFENKFLLNFLSLLIHGGASYLIFTFIPKIGHTFPNSLYYSIYFAFVCFYSYLYSNSLIRFVFFIPQKYLSKKFKTSDTKDKKYKLEDIFKENTKRRSHSFKKEAAIASIFVFLGSFVISIVYLTFSLKLKKLKKILLFATMIVGLIKYPILSHPWTFHIFSLFQGKKLITDATNSPQQKGKTGIKHALKNLKIGFEFVYKYMLMFPFILITFINNIDKLLESEKLLIITIAVSSWSTRLFSLVFNNPTTIPFSLIFVGLYNDWDYEKMTLCGVIDLMIIDEILNFMFTLKRYIKIFIANILDTPGSLNFILVITFYLISLNFYLMLVPLVAFFELNLYSLYGRKILLATFKSSDYLPKKCINESDEDEKNSENVNSMKKVLNMISINLFHYIDKNKLGFVEANDTICFEYQSKPYLLNICKIKSNKIKGELKRMPECFELTSSQNFYKASTDTKLIESMKHSLSNVQYFPITHKWPWRDFVEISVKNCSETDISTTYTTLSTYIENKKSKSKINCLINKICPKKAYKNFDDMIKDIESDENLDTGLNIFEQKSFMIGMLWLTIVCQNLKDQNIDIDDKCIDDVLSKLLAGEKEDQKLFFKLKISVKSNKKFFYFKRHAEFEPNTFYPVKINSNYLSHICTSLEFVSSQKYCNSDASGDLNYKSGTISALSIIKEFDKTANNLTTDNKNSPFCSHNFVSYRLASKLSSKIK